MSVLGTAGAMVTTHENSAMMWSFKGPKLLYVLFNPIGNETKWWISHFGVAYKLNSNPNLSRISDWSVHSGSYFSIRLGPLRWVPTAHCAGRRGLNLLTTVRPVELAQCLWHWQSLTNSPHMGIQHCKISDIRRTQNQNWNDSRLIMQLPLLNPLKPGVKSRMKM